MTSRTVSHYRKFRAAGETAQNALSSARILAKWELLEESGFVRIVARPDDSYDDSYMDEWSKTREGRASAKAARAQIENDGAWGVIGQYRTDFNPDRLYPDLDREWTTGDSVWACAGYRDPCNPFENCYVTDIMNQTMTTFRAEWKLLVRGLCRACKGTGKRGAN